MWARVNQKVRWDLFFWFQWKRYTAEGQGLQVLLGHVETTERDLGCKQRLRSTVNDHIGLES
jgi:hypothetical protein